MPRGKKINSVAWIQSLSPMTHDPPHPQKRKILLLTNSTFFLFKCFSKAAYLYMRAGLREFSSNSYVARSPSSCSTLALRRKVMLCHSPDHQNLHPLLRMKTTIHLNSDDYPLQNIFRLALSLSLVRHLTALMSCTWSGGRAQIIVNSPHTRRMTLLRTRTFRALFQFSLS